MQDFYLQESDDELVDDLEMFGDEEEGEEHLNEGAIEAYFTGINKDQLKDLKGELKNGITQSEKDKMLEVLDKMIDNSNRVLTDSSFITGAFTDFSAFCVAIGLGGVAGVTLLPVGGLLALGYIIRTLLRATSDRASFREACMDLRAEVKAAKVKK